MTPSEEEDLSQASDASDSIGMSTTTGANTNQEAAKSESDEGGNAAKVASKMQKTTLKKDEDLVRGARILVCSIIVLCAAAVCGSIYYFGTVGDKRSFESEVSSRRCMLDPLVPVHVFRARRRTLTEGTHTFLFFFVSIPLSLQLSLAMPIYPVYSFHYYYYYYHIIIV